VNPTQGCHVEDLDVKKHMRVSQKKYPPSVLKETAEYSFANCNLGRKDKRYLDKWYDYGAMRVWLKLLAHKKKHLKKNALLS